jgi:hypothetical protein
LEALRGTNPLVQSKEETQAKMEISFSEGQMEMTWGISVVVAQICMKEAFDQL